MRAKSDPGSRITLIYSHKCKIKPATAQRLHAEARRRGIWVASLTDRILNDALGQLEKQIIRVKSK